MTIRKTGLEDLLQYVDVLLPKAREATRITGTDDPELAIQQLARMVPLVVVKLGHEGALAQRGKERFISPSLTVTAVDAAGAGDSFDAGFLHQYLQARISQPAWLMATARARSP
jgi:sugar/nucleoside kinase (ribokinase family)